MTTKLEKHQNFTKTFQYGMALLLIAGLVVCVCGVRVISKDFQMPEPKNRPVLTPAPKVEMPRMIENGNPSGKESVDQNVSKFLYDADGNIISAQPVSGAAPVSSGNSSTNIDGNNASFRVAPGSMPTEGKSTFGVQ